VIYGGTKQRQKAKILIDRNHNEKTKREMLAAIRANLTTSKPFDVVHQDHHTVLSHTDGHAAIRDSVQPVGQSAMGTVERFRQSLEAVSGHCAIVRDEREAAAALQRIVEQTRARHVAISNSPLVERVISDLKFDGELLEGAEASALFAADLGISEAQRGVAETGTLVLESDRERNRLVSLVPPVHVAIIEAHRIGETLAEALQATHENGEEGLSRAVTFITGPSRTSDIELTLAIGVHGPAELYVIIIEGELALA
jgi:L-lactate dehydrogenase complex protein LldG